MPAAGGLSLTTSHWVIVRILRHRASDAATPTMTGITRLTDDLLFMIGIAHFTNGGPTVGVHATNFAGR